jgi:uncharacterized delta-60 repeat protein
MNGAHRAVAAAALALLLAAPAAGAAPGDLDTTFGGGDGVVLLSPRSGGQLGALTLQGDRLLAAGSVKSDDESCPGSDPALLRLLADGTPDPAFGTGGLSINRFAPGCEGRSDRSASLRAIATAPGGRILTGGWAAAPGEFNGAGWVSAHAPTGAFDPSFDGDGFVRDSDVSQGSFTGLVPLPDGRLTAVGHHTRLGSVWTARRYLAGGAPDPSFGGDGSLSYPPAGGSRGDLVRAAIPGDGGAVIAAGSSSGSEAQPGGAATIGRILTDGSLDPAFGDGGRTRVLFVAGEHTDAADVARTADGGYVMAGSAVVPTGDGTPSPATLLLMKVDDDGDVDETFGAGGRVDGPPGRAAALAVDASDRLVVAGFTETGAYVARYLVNGALDTSFGDDGLVPLPPAGPTFPADIAVQPDGRIVVGGTRRDGGRDSIGVVRLHGGDAAPGTGEVDGEIAGPGSPGAGPGGPPQGRPPVPGGPVPSRQDTSPARVSIRIVSFRVSARGVLVRARWPRGTDGTARARLWTRNKGILLGQRTVRARPGTIGRTFRVPLNARAKRLLRDGKRLKVTATLRVTGLPARR